jgi:hypothetical protein
MRNWWVVLHSESKGEGCGCGCVEETEGKEWGG